jgi:hypothetical protein
LVMTCTQKQAEALIMHVIFISSVPGSTVLHPGACLAGLYGMNSKPSLGTAVEGRVYKSPCLLRDPSCHGFPLRTDERLLSTWSGCRKVPSLLQAVQEMPIQLPKHLTCQFYLTIASTLV